MKLNSQIDLPRPPKANDADLERFVRDLQKNWGQLARILNNNLPVDLSVYPVYANNTAALAGGLVVGQHYRTGGDPDVVAVVK